MRFFFVKVESGGAMEDGLESSAWAGVSPRISFSHDPPSPQGGISNSTEGGDRRLDSSLPLVMPASSDFDFGLDASAILSHDSSLADDLFSDGKLLPVPIRNPPSSSSSSSASAAADAGRKRSSLREIMASSDEDDAGIRGPSPRRSFWRFRMSSSVKYGGSLCPLPLLRSKSSGQCGENKSDPERADAEQLRLPPLQASVRTKAMAES
ncbi:hypothetical protein GW17_00050013 [Ensete ventricosum]|nr:hypothetical protein GW17_00050013 [Ensete ventricosum]